MLGAAEILLGLVWKLLSLRQRQRLTQVLMVVQSRANQKIPLVNASVYAWTPSNQRLFAAFLAAGLEQKRSSKLEKLPKYSLVSTCRNEADSITAFLNSVLHQSFLPAEVVICDGGSTDKTLARIQNWQEKNKAADGSLPFLLKIIQGVNVNIAAGRNLAVSESAGQWLLFCDAGTLLDKHWAELLLQAWIYKPNTEVAMGWYKPIVTTAFERALAQLLLPDLEAVDPQTFFPSARSLAIKKEVFFRVGGYPEHLSFAGEDTLFDYYLKTAVQEVAFVPEAVVHWKFPRGLRAAARTIFNYARGDAEGGVLFGDSYLSLINTTARSLLEMLLCLLLLIFGAAWHNTLLLIAACFCGICGIVRSFSLLTRYLPSGSKSFSLKRKIKILQAAALMAASQSAGFVFGLASRVYSEQRRICRAKRGHLLLLLPQFVKFQQNERDTVIVQEKLEQGWYLTIVYAQSLQMPDLKHPAFAHPQLEQHLRSHFDLEAWHAKHQQFILLPGREFAFLDLCKDAWAGEIGRKLVQYGAKALQEAEN